MNNASRIDHAGFLQFQPVQRFIEASCIPAKTLVKTTDSLPSQSAAGYYSVAIIFLTRSFALLFPLNIPSPFEIETWHFIPWLGNLRFPRC
jgi:hypothetical protein